MLLLLHWSLCVIRESGTTAFCLLFLRLELTSRSWLHPNMAVKPQAEVDPSATDASRLVHTWAGSLGTGWSLEQFRISGHAEPGVMKGAVINKLCLNRNSLARWAKCFLLSFAQRLVGFLAAQTVKNLPAMWPWVRRSPGEGNGYSLQQAYLENPMDRGAWQATVQGVAKSRTWLSD